MHARSLPRSLPPSILHIHVSNRSIDRGCRLSVPWCVSVCVHRSHSVRFLSKAWSERRRRRRRYTHLALHGRGGGSGGGGGRSTKGKGKREEGREEGRTEEALESQGRILSELKGQARGAASDRPPRAPSSDCFLWPSCSNKRRAPTFLPFLEIFHFGAFGGMDCGEAATMQQGGVFHIMTLAMKGRRAQQFWTFFMKLHRDRLKRGP